MNCVLTMAVLVATVTLAAGETQSLVVDAAKASIKTEGAALPDGWNLWSNGKVAQPVRIATAGTYEVVVRAWGSAASGVWPQMGLLIDGDVITTVYVNPAKHANYTFSVSLGIGLHEVAAAFRNDAVVGKEDRNLYLERLTITAPEGAAAPLVSNEREMDEQAERREHEVLAATKQAIEQNRKSDAVVRVLDSSGKPVAGTKVTLTQTTHEFLFGCNIYGFQNGGVYRQRFAELFNYATLGFYWRSYERERGKPRYSDTDKIVSWCLEHGIRMKGHPLLYGNEAGVPRWSEGLPAPEIQRQRVEDIMTRYRDKIFAWEVVNEPSHQPIPKIEAPYRWARAINPNAFLIINDCYILDDGCPQFFELLTTARKNGVPFDGIGIQAHEPRARRFPLDHVNRTLDHYSTLGKELHITEFTPASDGERITGSYCHGIWDEAAQADYAIKFYRLAFAHPFVRAITWWDLSDKNSWRKGGGLLRADMSPKPAYDRLKQLIHEEWTTRAAGVTDHEGKFAFRGFRGHYRVEVNSTEKEFDLRRDGPPELTVSLP